MPFDTSNRITDQKLEFLRKNIENVQAKSFNIEAVDTIKKYTKEELVEKRMAIITSNLTRFYTLIK